MGNNNICRSIAACGASLLLAGSFLAGAVQLTSFELVCGADEERPKGRDTNPGEREDPRPQIERPEPIPENGNAGDRPRERSLLDATNERVPEEGRLGEIVDLPGEDMEIDYDANVANSQANASPPVSDPVIALESVYGSVPSGDYEPGFNPAEPLPTPPADPQAESQSEPPLPRLPSPRSIIIAESRQAFRDAQQVAAAAGITFGEYLARTRGVVNGPPPLPEPPPSAGEIQPAAPQTQNSEYARLPPPSNPPVLIGRHRVPDNSNKGK